MLLNVRHFTRQAVLRDTNVQYDVYALGSLYKGCPFLTSNYHIIKIASSVACSIEMSSCTVIKGIIKSVGSDLFHS